MLVAPQCRCCFGRGRGETVACLAGTCQCTAGLSCMQRSPAVLCACVIGGPSLLEETHRRVAGVQRLPTVLHGKQGGGELGGLASPATGVLTAAATGLDFVVTRPLSHTRLISPAAVLHTKVTVVAALVTVLEDASDAGMQVTMQKWWKGKAHAASRIQSSYNAIISAATFPFCNLVQVPHC